jgi:uncharacterized protein
VNEGTNQRRFLFKDINLRNSAGLTSTREREVSRYRNLKGGLDNAVRQAEERDLFRFFIVDADCHQKEPFKLIMNYVKDANVRKVFLAPDPDDPLMSRKNTKGEFEGSRWKDVRRGPRKRPEVSEPKPQPPEEVIEVFTKRMHDLGIKRSVVFPTELFAVAMDKRKWLEVAATRAYDDFYLDQFSGKYPEMMSPLAIPVNSPQKAAEIIDDLGSEKGIMGVMVPSMTPTLAGNAEWDPIYEAAQAKGLPICMHGSNYFGGMLQDFGKFIGAFTLSRPITLATQMTSIVFNGVPERFPKLKYVFIEGGVTWIPWIMQRMDSVYIMRKDEAPLLTKMPSEYAKQFYYTTQPLEYTDPANLEYCFKQFNAEDQLLFSSDYPHWDFDVPSVIYDLPFLSDKAKRNILGETAAKLFKVN